MTTQSPGGFSVGAEEFLSRVDSAAVVVALSEIYEADSPRRGKVDEAHVKLLAESLDQCPPIVIHRSTMRVIDGVHRVRAARLLGIDTISARFFDGTVEEAFALAVQLNVKHGLPLALADRKAAAARLLVEQPGWSNRAIAAVSGVSDKTVAAIRNRSTAENPQPTTRLARNGVLHPVDGKAGRRRVAELLESDPEMSLAELARSTGVSLTTVKDVRKRLRRDDSSVPSELLGRVASGSPGAARGEGKPGVDEAALVERLRRDPSVRFNQAGRMFLRWLEAPIEWEAIAPSIPAHCAALFAELARKRSEELRRSADYLDSLSESLGDTKAGNSA
ncbi:helix-turn-helix domain-containing protein [Nocardia tengchongensis]|uniref:ParB/RepB/Spo0J family partition protein n=1 Tax=Nocardia tengchongensis TaxID=2055889 RepID=UPI0036A11FAC